MKYRELISKLGVSDSKFKFALRNSTKIRPGCGTDEYSSEEFKLLKNYFDALLAVKLAKVALGWAKTKPGIHRCYYTKDEAIKKNLIFTKMDLK